ncbi:MAG: hypothetical protein V7K48_07415 [Nostoc sp.]|uniref:hypothetical protein n=1 Tax=Nostoc sp. TaxID=1180 RepID=UPI002FFA3E16
MNCGASILVGDKFVNNAVQELQVNHQPSSIDVKNAVQELILKATVPNVDFAKNKGSEIG